MKKIKEVLKFIAILSILGFLVFVIWMLWYLHAIRADPGLVIICAISLNFAGFAWIALVMHILNAIDGVKE